MPRDKMKTKVYFDVTLKVKHDSEDILKKFIKVFKKTLKELGRGSGGNFKVTKVEDVGWDYLNWGTDDAEES